MDETAVAAMREGVRPRVCDLCTNNSSNQTVPQFACSFGSKVICRLPIASIYKVKGGGEAGKDLGHPAIVGGVIASSCDSRPTLAACDLSDNRFSFLLFVVGAGGICSPRYCDSKASSLVSLPIQQRRMVSRSLGRFFFAPERGRKANPANHHMTHYLATTPLFRTLVVATLQINSNTKTFQKVGGGGG
jgi:hypothetical protein